MNIEQAKEMAAQSIPIPKVAHLGYHENMMLGADARQRVDRLYNDINRLSKLIQHLDKKRREAGLTAVMAERLGSAILDYQKAREELGECLSHLGVRKIHSVDPEEWGPVGLQYLRIASHYRQQELL